MYTRASDNTFCFSNVGKSFDPPIRKKGKKDREERAQSTFLRAETKPHREVAKVHQPRAYITTCLHHNNRSTN